MTEKEKFTIKKIQELLKEQNRNKKELCEYLNVSPTNFGNWVSGRNVSFMKYTHAIASFFDVSVDYLLGNTDKQKEDDFDIFSISGITPVKTKKLPVLGSVACGKPIFAEEEYQGYISVDEDINADFCLLAKGDSMINAGIKDGSIVFVKKQPTVDNGQIAVVLIEDEATLKRVYFDDVNKRLILNPCNDAYSPIIIENEQLITGQIRILGRAIACQFKVR